MKKNTIITASIIGITIISIVSVFGRGSEGLAESPLSQLNNDLQTAYYLATSSILVPVVGTVTAAKSATIYAQTAGVVTTLPYKEGAVVTTGVPLSVQATPVLAAQVQLAQAQAGLTGAQQRAGVSAQGDKVQIASARLLSATEVARLRAAQNDARITESLDTLLGTIHVNATVALSAMDYISNNRSLFSGDGLRQFEQVLRYVYGMPPSYFNGGIMYGGSRPLSLREQLEAIQKSADVTPLAIENATTLTLSILETLAQVLVTAERQTFDRMIKTDKSTSAYLAQKNAVASAILSLQATKQAVQQVIDKALEDYVVQGSQVTVSELDEAAALAQRMFAEEIADWSAAVTAAQIGVVVEQAALGTVRAPFAGVVSRVLIEEGEYVSPGTPLLQLVGDGAREIIVTVPASFGELITPGQSFVVAGQVAGVVDRVSPATVGSGQMVVIALQQSNVRVGESVRGSIVTESTDTVYAVPRSYVYFGDNGPFIRYQTGEESPVYILHDAMGTLYVEVVTVLTESLVPVAGVTL